MIIARIIGTAISTLKDDRLQTSKLLLLNPANAAGELGGEPFIAVDLVGAGEGELVFVVQGSSARMAVGSADAPVDAAIVGILDSLSVEGQTTYFKT